ncbi:V-type ATP synthase subunit F [Lacrimispora sp. JR3]|uniref:V-type ATP synthase subunit F n=1 Tax=Lacrimispora sinapis TaxID=3111456 RepID=UPI00374A9898
MYKMAVIGDRESILIFKAFGADIFAADEADVMQNRRLVNQLAKDGYAIILITEQVASHLSEVLEHFGREPLPAISVIPSMEGSHGLAELRMKKNVERAVGMNI